MTADQAGGEQPRRHSHLSATRRTTCREIHTGGWTLNPTAATSGDESYHVESAATRTRAGSR